MKKRLLLVDDDVYLRNSISAYLVSEGFFVYAVDNVYNALVIIKENPPDLIITDIMMPDIDGYDFVKILHFENNIVNIPIILLTAKGMTEDRIRGYDLGCNAYLTKPFDPKELVSIINNLLRNVNFLINLDISEKNISSNSEFIRDNLTYREITILRLVVKGFRNKEIAAHLNVSIRNVEKYVSRLLNKTSTRNRTELAQFIINKGIYLDDKGE